LKITPREKERKEKNNTKIEIIETHEKK